MRFTTKYFDGKTTKAHLVEVVCEYGLSTVSVRVLSEDYDSEKRVFQLSINDLELREAIGRHYGSIVFNDQCEILLPDRDSHQFFKKSIPNKSFWLWVNNIENSWPFVLVGLAVVAFFVWSLVYWGLPAAAKSVALKSPDAVLESLGHQALNQLEESFLDETQLEHDKRIIIEAGFLNILKSNNLDISKYKLNFYHSKGMGPNAFALPSGDIVLLDDLVNLDGFSMDEVNAVLAHEIAHVEQRHGIQMLIRYAGIGALLSVALGDIQSTVGLVAVVPKLLIEKGYSREFEAEADQYAVKYLLNSGMNPYMLISSLEKLSQSSGVDMMPGLLSTHPLFEKRKEVIMDEIRNVTR